MKFKKLAGLAVAGLLALAATSVQADALRVGVEGAYPPFSWKEADGTLKGFDIDFAHEVCKRLGRECVLVEQEWDGMIPALLARKFDTIIASMSITEERKKKVDFTVKYYNTPARTQGLKALLRASTASVWAYNVPQRTSVLPRNSTPGLNWSCMRLKTKCGKTLHQADSMPSCLTHYKHMRVF